MHLQKKIALFLVSLLMAATLPMSGSLLCPSPAQSRETWSNGSGGRPGREGAAGRSGDEQTVFAGGAPITLDLSGRNGEDGRDGEDGDRPDYCGTHDSADKPERDMDAPSGGDGGAGGDGGRGGNGGNLTVYYQNLSDVRLIAVRAEGGEGGRGGYGGRGARGCECDRRSWVVEKCKGSPGTAGYSCKKKTYRCRDGRTGQSGDDGRRGDRGDRGTLSLVNQTTPLQADQPTVRLPLARLADPVDLSLNRWELRQGAAALLAPGSILADSYRVFVERITGTFRLVWQDSAAIAGFADQPVVVTLRDRGNVQLTFPDQLWVDGTLSQQGDQTQYTVTHAIRKSDVTRLSVADFSQAGKNLQLSLVDLGGRAEALNTEFRLRYRTREASVADRFARDYETRYDSVVPSTWVSRHYNRYVLSLGQLPIRPEHLDQGTEVEIELTAIRTLGDRTAQQNLRWDGTVRGDR